MCPDFFPLGDRHMLLFISHNLGCQYYIGRYENDHFDPETHGRMTWVDNAYFAPESLLDDQGRRIMWAWIKDGRELATSEASRWSGVMSLPRVLWLGEDKTLRMAPAEELSLLRYHPRKHEQITIGQDEEVALDDVKGSAFELIVEFASEHASQFGVKIACSPDGEEQTAIFYDKDAQQLKIDTTRSSLGEGPKSVEAGPLVLMPNEKLKLRIFASLNAQTFFKCLPRTVARSGSY